MGTSQPSSSSSSWWPTWESYVTELRAAIKSKCAEKDIHTILTECYNAYAGHLRVASIDEALSVISGYDCSSLEVVFMWMGRWRPTSAVVLVYSTMGVDFKGTNTEFEEYVNKDFKDMYPLNEKQLSGLSTIQNYAAEAESDISQQSAVIQMLLVEQNTVSALKLGEVSTVDDQDMAEFQQLIDVKLKELQELLEKADTLRLHTLKMLADLLSPVQTALCVVSAYELLVALRSLSETMEHAGGAAATAAAAGEGYNRGLVCGQERADPILFLSNKIGCQEANRPNQAVGHKWETKNPSLKVLECGDTEKAH